MRAELKRLRYHPWLIGLFVLLIGIGILQPVFKWQSQDYQVLDRFIPLLNDYQQKNLDLQSYVIDDFHNETPFIRYQTFRSFRQDVYQEIQSTKRKLEIEMFQGENIQKQLKIRLDVLNHVNHTPFSIINDVLYIGILKFLPMFFTLWLIVSICLIYYLLLKDDQNHFIELYRTTFTGARKLYFQRIFVFFGMIGIGFVIKLIADLLILKLTGFPFDRPIMMIYGFYHVMTKMNALQWYLLQWLIHFCLLFAICGIFIGLYQWLRHFFLLVIAFMTFLFVEYLCYAFILLASPFGFLKIVNIFYIVHFAYRTIILIKPITMLLMVFGFGLCGVIGYGYMAIQYGKSKTKTAHCNWFGWFHLPTLWLNQVHQILFPSKLIILLCLIGGFMTYQYHTYRAYLPSYDNKYQAFKQNFYGPITPELENKIYQGQKESNEAAAIWNQLTDEDLVTMIPEEIYAITEKMSGAHHYDLLIEDLQKAKAKGSQYFVDDRFFAYWFVDGSLYEWMYNSMIFLFVAVLAGMIGRQQFQTCIGHLAATTIKKYRYRLNHLVLLMIGSILCVGSIFLIRFLMVLKVYKFKIMEIGAQNYFNIYTSLKITPYLILYFVNWLMVCLAFGALTILLCRKFSSLIAMVIGFSTMMVLFLIPFGIREMIGIHYLQYPFVYGLWMVICLLLIGFAFQHLYRFHKSS